MDINNCGVVKVFTGAVTALLLSAQVGAETRYVTIGTGGQTGVYYTAGQSVCRFLNRDAEEHDIKCNARARAYFAVNLTKE